MHKRKLHHLWVRIRPVGAGYFAAAMAVCLVVGIVSLRQNNLRAIELREQVMAVDQANGDVEAALRELREHIHSHMNSNLSAGATSLQHPVQLKHRYERLVKAERQRVSQENEKIYTQAQSYCESRHPRGVSGSGRLPCIENYVEENGVEERTIPDALYKFNFVSPRWSPDIAGWSLVAAAIFGLLFVVRLALDRWLRHKLHEHL